MDLLTRRLVFSIIMASLSIFLVAALWSAPTTLLILFVFITLVDFTTWRSKLDMTFYAAAGISGPIAEWIAIYYGAWSYAMPDLILIPGWLILCWGLWGLFMMRLYEVIKNKWLIKNKK